MTDSIFISKIELQNPRKKSYALYQDDTFLTEITEDTLVHFAISRGNTFNKREFEKVLRHDKVTLCLRQAYTYLSRRPHLKKELQRKLKQKLFPQDIIDQTIIHLKKNKYIDDNEYIRMFIRDALRQNKTGPLLIKKKLLEKGASFEMIDIQLDELFPYVKQYEIALNLLNSKNQKLKEDNLLIQKQKLQKFGMGRGFSWAVLEPVLSQLIKE
jgi:regulatory protein